MKKFLKVFICVISSLVVAVVLMFCFMATRLWYTKQERKYVYDVAEIYISHEYKDKFLNKEFKLEDFGIKNIKILILLKIFITNPQKHFLNCFILQKPCRLVAKKQTSIYLTNKLCKLTH